MILLPCFVCGSEEVCIHREPSLLPEAARRLYFASNLHKLPTEYPTTREGKIALRKIARSAVNNAIRLGKLSRPDTCDKCRRRRKVQAHHDDYMRPLDILWLCSTCHGHADKMAGTSGPIRDDPAPMGNGYYVERSGKLSAPPDYALRKPEDPD